MIVEQIISGAQAGADRAGLDAGLALGLKIGGWVPRDRRTENGPLTDEEMLKYNLREHISFGYKIRTLQNVLDSDGTVIFGDVSSPGSRLTINYCEMRGKIWIANPDNETFRDWLTVGVRVLNVAGNRESVNPGIYQRTLAFLMDALGG